MITKPTIEEVNAIDLSPWYDLITTNNENYLAQPAGVEHYKLLGWLSNQFDDTTIVEIGTLSGFGTIALSMNQSNKVITFDIRDYQWKNKVPENAERKIVYDGYMDEVMLSPIVFYDAAHEGKEEQEFLDYLIEHNWKGVLVLDDIHLNKEMEKFWSDITLPKEDWTDLGHACGTGIVFFN